MVKNFGGKNFNGLVPRICLAGKVLVNLVFIQKENKSLEDKTLAN